MNHAFPINTRCAIKEVYSFLSNSVSSPINWAICGEWQLSPNPGHGVRHSPAFRQRGVTMWLSSNQRDLSSRDVGPTLTASHSCPLLAAYQCPELRNRTWTRAEFPSAWVTMWSRDSPPLLYSHQCTLTPLKARNKHQASLYILGTIQPVVMNTPFLQPNGRLP